MSHEATPIPNNDIYLIANENDHNAIQSDILTEKKEKRERTFEKKEVVHHGPFRIFFGRNHTHATIFHVTFTEERIAKTYKDGRIIYTDWSIVHGSQIKKEITRFEENGWTDGYEIEITKN